MIWIILFIGEYIVFLFGLIVIFFFIDFEENIGLLIELRVVILLVRGLIIVFIVVGLLVFVIWFVFIFEVLIDVCLVIVFVVKILEDFVLL